LSSASSEFLHVDAVEDLPTSAGYRGWLDHWHGPGEQKALARGALDAYDRERATGSLMDDDLQPILAAARSSRFAVWDIGLRMLCRVAGRHALALAALEGLFDSGKAMLRCRVVTSLRDCLPREFCVHLARRGLADRTKSVRVGAGQTCQRLLLKELLGEMIRVEQNEKCAKTRLLMRWSIGLLRDAFFLWPPDEDGSRTLEVRISEGVPQEYVYLGPPWCPESVSTEEEARPYVEEFRRVQGRTQRPFRWDDEGRTSG
jgi:hypothetical protein